MKSIRYSRYTGEDLDIAAEDLLRALADFLLQSGFNTQDSQFNEWDQNTLEELKEALRQALEEGRLFDDDRLEQMMERLASMTPEQVEQLLDRLVQKMIDEGQITMPEQPDEAQPGAGQGQGKESSVKFELTDKSLDFLGFKTLKDLLGSLGTTSSATC